MTCNRCGTWHDPQTGHSPLVSATKDESVVLCQDCIVIALFHQDDPFALGDCDDPEHRHVREELVDWALRAMSAKNGARKQILPVLKNTYDRLYEERA